jgi:predicted nucleic acid-binding protein
MVAASVSREMNCMNAVDTNVLVYAFDIDEPAKRAKASELITRLVQTGESVLLWQVACEFIAAMRRWQAKGRVSAEDVGAYAGEMLSYFPLMLPVAGVIPRSFELSARFSLSHWDSLLAAAAIEAGVDTLYTEDLQAGATYETLSIVNPFA